MLLSSDFDLSTLFSFLPSNYISDLAKELGNEKEEEEEEVKSFASIAWSTITEKSLLLLLFLSSFTVLAAERFAFSNTATLYREDNVLILLLSLRSLFLIMLLQS